MIGRCEIWMRKSAITGILLLTVPQIEADIERDGEREMDLEVGRGE